MTTIQLQLEDEASLSAADPIIAEANLTLSWVVEHVLRRIVHEGCVRIDLFAPNETTLEALREADNGTLKSFPDIASLMADLHAED